MIDEPLEKAVWTDGDFDTMGWHDATVHAIAFHEDEQGTQDALLLDLDYIVRWLDPEPPARSFTFLVAPATLVFENVSSLQGELDTRYSRMPLHINTIERGEAEYAWVVEGHDFALTLFASGFRQHFRGRPIHTASQRLQLDARGGISFDQPLDLPA
jgi:hypothetical protein